MNYKLSVKSHRANPENPSSFLLPFPLAHQKHTLPGGSKHTHFSGPALLTAPDWLSTETIADGSAGCR